MLSAVVVAALVGFSNGAHARPAPPLPRVTAPAVPALAVPAEVVSNEVVPSESVSGTDDAARLLAGLSLAPTSEAWKLSTTAAVKKHAQAIDSVWRTVTAPRMRQIRDFAARELADVDGHAVFYPFGGPDILNAIALFPEASTYTLLGLEPVGPLPTTSLYADAPTLALVQRALSHALRHNLFVTDIMQEQVRGQVGVAALLAFFLARSGYAIEEARLVTLGADGSLLDDVVVDAEADANRARGVEIVVHLQGTSRVQRVRYFSGNVNDDFFSRTTGLAPHLFGQGSLTTVLKAASYLMYYPAFDDIRAVVLDRSGTVVTDTSGMPFHRLDQPTWQLALYGTYKAPIRAFADRCQPDLQAALRERGRGELPFLYGYTYSGHNHLIVARRAPGRELEMPRFDGTKYQGQNTLCVHGRLRIERVKQ